MTSQSHGGQQAAGDDQRGENDLDRFERGEDETRQEVGALFELL